MPSLVIGLDEDRFWKQTPKTILVYFDAARIREQKRAQELWTIGAYVKQALCSTILVASLADKNTHNQMPKFPPCPYKDKDEKRELTEEEIEKLCQ